MNEKYVQYSKSEIVIEPSMFEFWSGDALGAPDDSPFWTAYPTQAEFPSVISFTQGLVARAIYEWVHSGYNTTGYDYETWCKRALNHGVAITSGKWGGYWYHPKDQGGTTHFAGMEEYFPYTACMVLGMHVVDSTTYAERIAGNKLWMDAITNDDGKVWNEQHPNGALKNNPSSDTKFLAINTAYMLLVKAHGV